jgi:hypothetical protein
MMRKASEFYDKPIYAVDGEAGKLQGLLFYDDDRSWKIRYLVVELGGWFKLKRMLVLPVTLASFDGALLKVQLTKDEICKCPDSGFCNPVNIPQKERTETLFNAARIFSGLCDGSGAALFPILASANDLNADKIWNRHLRSSREISRYKINTDDGVAGNIEDLLIDDRFWIIRFLLVIPSEKLGKETRMVAAYLVEKLDMATGTLYLECGSDYMMRCLMFDPVSHVNVSYEDFLKNYHVMAKTNYAALR